MSTPTERHTIALGSDHAGVEMRAAVRRELEAAGYDVLEFGPSDETPVDYPDVAAAVGNAITAGRAPWGVLVCGTGIGMSIAANKLPGIRAALCGDPFSAQMSREHNDANVLCLGGRVLTSESAIPVLRAWLEAAPSLDERHVRRRDKVDVMDQRNAAP